MGVDRLTEREKETLRLLLAGHDAKSSARELGLSVHTVNERLRDARRKLGVGNSRQAARMLAAAEPGEGQIAWGAGPQSPVPETFGVARGSGDTASGGQRGRRLAWIAGGLTMIAIVAAALIFAPVQRQAPPSAPTPPAAVTDEAGSASAAEARRWMALVDAGRWVDSWRAAGDIFRRGVTAEQWAAMVTPVRGPLGAVRQRRFLSSTPTTALPGAPDGDYEVVQFSTDFADRTGAVETVILLREDGGWGVAGYFVR